MPTPPGETHDHGDHDLPEGAGHNHAPSVTASNEQHVRLVFLITAGYAVVQAVGGALSGSLALIADAGHMVSDAAALLLALIVLPRSRPWQELRLAITGVGTQRGRVKVHNRL